MILVHILSNFTKHQKIFLLGWFLQGIYFGKRNSFQVGFLSGDKSTITLSLFVLAAICSPSNSYYPPFFQNPEPKILDRYLYSKSAKELSYLLDGESSQGRGS